MNNLKRFYKIFALVLILSLAIPTSLPFGNDTVAQAATIKITKKTLALEVGNSASLKLTGTSKKASWASSKKSVATVSKAGKVTAVKAGNSTITATLNKKKYTCKVTVTDLDSDIVNAPFEAQKLTLDKVSTVFPKDWVHKEVTQSNGSLLSLIYPSSADITKGTSNITISLQKTGTPKPDYSITKQTLELILTEDFIKSQLVNAGMNAEILDFATSDYTTKNGTAFQADYTATVSGITFKQRAYAIYIDNYYIEVTVTDNSVSLEPDIYTVAKYILDTVREVK